MMCPVNILSAAPDTGNVSTCLLCYSHICVDGIRFHPVIAVKEGQINSVCILNADISRSRNPSVNRTNDADPGILSGKFVANKKTAIG